MPDAQCFKGKTGRVLGLALLLAGVTGTPAPAQETVYIGGREAGPAVQVDFSALNPAGGIPVRRTRPGPPDILPLNPANAPQARAATSMTLPPLQPSAPIAAQPTAPAPSGANGIIAPLPLKPGLTPAATPRQPVANAGLSASKPPRPITPVRQEMPAISPPAPAAVTPPPPVAAPQAVAALPAGLTPAKTAAPSSAAALLFPPGEIELTPEATAQLDAVLASLTDKQRLQLKAHASGAQDDAEVRRIALKRALSARSHLLAGGLDSTRIDVRALGPAGDGGPDDRLDVIVVAQ
jgi:outer membrane protein OmpA-like peptidoglycan-associated protein